MRYFAKPLSLERLSIEARIVYTGFCAFLLFGYATSAWLYLDDEMGTSSSSVERYYLGEAQPALAHNEITIPSGGPSIDVPLDTPSASMRFAKPPRQVMETFHFHLLTVPVVLLIVAHLFMMCSMSTRTKAWLIALTTLATFVHIVLPPLIRFASPKFGVLMFPSAAIMGALWAYMTIMPIYEMWRITIVADTSPERD